MSDNGFIKIKTCRCGGEPKLKQCIEKKGSGQFAGTYWVECTNCGIASRRVGAYLITDERAKKWAVDYWNMAVDYWSMAVPLKHKSNTDSEITGAQEKAVLAYLREEGSITALQAFWFTPRITRLAMVVNRLRKRGYNIVTTLHGKERYAVYSFEGEE